MIGDLLDFAGSPHPPPPLHWCRVLWGSVTPAHAVAFTIIDDKFGRFFLRELQGFESLSPDEHEHARTKYC